MDQAHHESLFQSIIDQAPDALVYADREGVIRTWNGCAERLFGYAAAQAVGQSLDLIIPERFRAAHWAGFELALSTGETKDAGRVLTTRSMHADGRAIYVDLSFGLIKDRTGATVGVLAIGRDVTERQRSRGVRTDAGATGGVA